MNYLIEQEKQIEDEIMLENIKTQVIKALHEKVVYVKFTKADGTEREMNCTLMSKYLPESEGVKGKSKENPDSIAVWDIDLDAWRSFRYDRIISYQT